MPHSSGQSKRIEERKRHRFKMKSMEAMIKLLLHLSLLSAARCDNVLVQSRPPPQMFSAGSGSELHESRTSGPRFDLHSGQVVGSRWESQVFLPCKIFDLDEEQTVSWIRRRDSLLLTIGPLKMVEDRRFRLAQTGQDWTLVLSNPKDSDSGLYECQVSSVEPKLSQLVELRMVEARSRLSNLSTLFVKPYEPLNLTCRIESAQPTDFVYWYKNNSKEPIHFDNLKARRPIPRPTDLVSVSADTVGRQRLRSSSRAAKGAEEAGLDEDEILVQHQEPNYINQEATNKNGQPDPMKLLRSSSSLIIKQNQLNESANYTCLPEMRDALRIHIIRKRQRLKQEQEQDAIEKRIKRERELKQVQDAMTLDQIKEQLGTLEKRLESLRDEKHDLFVRLKQVLNEDSSKRRVESEQKKQIGETNASSSKNQSATNSIDDDGNRKLDTNLLATKPQVANHMPRPPITVNPLPSIASSHAAKINQHLPHNHNMNITASTLLPTLPTHATPNYFSKQSTSSGPSRPPLAREYHQHSQLQRDPSLVAFGQSDLAQFRAQSVVGHRPLLSELATPKGLILSHYDPNINPIHNKRSSSVANLNDCTQDERSLGRKKLNTSSYPGPFSLNGVSQMITNLGHNISTSNCIQSSASTSNPTKLQSVQSSAANMMPLNFIHSRKPMPNHLPPNFDFMMSPNKPGLMIPGLNSFYPGPQHLIPPNSIYTGNESDLRHPFNQPFSPYNQQFSPGHHYGLPQMTPQNEQNAQFLASSANYHRKNPQQRNPYHHK